MENLYFQDDTLGPGQSQKCGNEILKEMGNEGKAGKRGNGYDDNCIWGRVTVNNIGGIFTVQFENAEGPACHVGDGKRSDRHISCGSCAQIYHRRSDRTGIFPVGW